LISQIDFVFVWFTGYQPKGTRMRYTLPSKIALTAALTFAPLTAASAATLFTDNFNGTPTGLNATPSGWIVSNGTVDIIGDGFFDFYPGNGNYIDLDGSSNNAGRIETVSTFDLVAGTTYTISFDYGKNAANPETLSFGLGASSGTLNLAAGTISNFLSFSFSFVAATDIAAAVLFFEAAGSDNQGPVLDNVVLTAEPPNADVPLPSALLLLASAIGGLGILKRRSVKV
jgi:hypothetical protein